LGESWVAKWKKPGESEGKGKVEKQKNDCELGEGRKVSEVIFKIVSGRNGGGVERRQDRLWPPPAGTFGIVSEHLVVKGGSWENRVFGPARGVLEVKKMP